MARDNGAPARTRTWDQLIKSQLLYQLSYRGHQRPRSIAITRRLVNLGFAVFARFRNAFSFCARTFAF